MVVEHAQRISILHSRRMRLIPVSQRAAVHGERESSRKTRGCGQPMKLEQHLVEIDLGIWGQPFESKLPPLIPVNLIAPGSMASAKVKLLMGYLVLRAWRFAMVEVDNNNAAGRCTSQIPAFWLAVVDSMKRQNNDAALVTSCAKDLTRSMADESRNLNPVAFRSISRCTQNNNTTLGTSSVLLRAVDGKAPIDGNIRLVGLKHRSIQFPVNMGRPTVRRILPALE